MPPASVLSPGTRRPAVLARYLELREPLATMAAAAATTPTTPRIQYMLGTVLNRGAVSGEE